MNYDWLPFAAFIISLISLFLTLLKYYLDWKETRLNIEIKLHDSYKFFRSGKNILEVTFINKTMYSVSISQIEFYLQSQNATFISERKSQLISTNSKTKVEFHSEGFPINLDSYESKRVYIVINGIFAMWVHDLEMTVESNKGIYKIEIPKNSVEYKDFIEIFD